MPALSPSDIFPIALQQCKNVSILEKNFDVLVKQGTKDNLHLDPQNSMIERCEAMKSTQEEGVT